MLAHEARSWVSSPLGVNYLLSMFKGSKKSLKIFMQNCYKLKNKPECTTNSKIFSMPNSKFMDLLKDTKDTDCSECPRDAALAWVKGNTEFKNVELEQNIPQLAQLILLNVSSFKSCWANSNSASGGSTTMKIYNSFSYTQDIKYEARILELPMQDKDFKLVLIAPNQVDLLHTLFRRMANQGLQAALCNIQPLFTVESKLTTPSMQFMSEKVFEMDIDQLGNVPITQIGKANVNNKEARFSVLSYLYVNWVVRDAEKPDLSKIRPPFFFCIVFKDTPIFNGQLNYDD